jgi:hypothetical protein
MNKNFTVIAILAALGIGHAQAQSTASANQTSTSQSVAQGSIQFSTSPEHTTQTVRNVGAIANGSAAFSASPLNCGQTSQGGIAIAGLSVIGGTSTSPLDCRLAVAAAELARQATIDTEHRAALLDAAIGVRCQLSEEVYNAMVDAGLDCKRKPKELISRTDTQPESTRIAGN